jgi:hypothetical protein
MYECNHEPAGTPIPVSSVLRFPSLSRLKLSFMLLLMIAGTAQSQDYVLNQGLRPAERKWMDIPDNPLLVLDIFTVECWVYAESRFVIVSRDRPGNLRPDWSVVFEETQQRIEFMTGMNSQADEYFFSPVGSFPREKWNHLALVVNGVTGTLIIYINGNHSATRTFAPRSFTVQTGLAWGGYFGNSLGASGFGILDEAKYWYGERSQSQIQSSMNIAQPLHDRANLRGYWRFCGDLADSSGFRHDGWAQGGVEIVEIRDLPLGLNCPCISEIPVTINPAWALLCEGGTLTLTALGGYVRYHWNTGATGRSIVVDREGTYSVVVTDNAGCNSTAEVEVRKRPNPVVLATPDTTLCRPGEAIRLNASAMNGTPPYRYSWTPATELDAPDKAQPTARPSATRVYRVVVTDHAGCTSEDSIVVAVAPELWLDLPDSISVCFGGEVQLPLQVYGGVPPYSFRWSYSQYISAANVQNPRVWPPTSRTFYVTVTDAAGCTAEDSIRVVVTQDMTVTATGEQRICEGDSVALDATVSGGVGPFRYQWRPAAGLNSADRRNPIASPGVSTTYIVRVIDSAGCIAEDSVTILVAAQIVLSLPDTLFLCEVDSVRLPLQVSGGDGMYRYHWQPPLHLDNPTIRQPIASPPDEMMYRVMVNDSSGCYSEDSVYVAFSPVPELLLPDTLVICPGTNIQLPLQIGRAITPVRYHWTPAATLSDISVQQPIATPKQPTMYRVRATDAVGCVTEDSIFVTLFDGGELLLSANGPTDFCEPDSVQLVASSGFTEYRWTIPGAQRITNSNTIIARRSGAHRVAVIDKYGCELLSNVILVRVHQKPDPVIDGPRVVCINSTHQYHTSNGQGISSFWRVEEGEMLQNDSTGAATIHWSTLGRQRLSLLQTIHPTGCSDSTTILVDVVDRIDVSLTLAGPLLLCEGDSAILTADGRFSQYEWKRLPDEIISNDSLLIIREAGHYALRILSNDGCEGFSDTLEVRIIPRPHIAISGILHVCAGDTVEYTATAPPGALRWSVSDGHILGTDTSSTVRIVWGHSTSGMLTALLDPDGQGLPCPGIARLDIRIGGIETPWVTAIPEGIICEGDSVLLTAQPGYAQYRWYRGDGRLVAEGLTHAARNQDVYYVTVVDSAGCEAASPMLAVSIHQRPEINITGIEAVCLGSIADYCVPPSTSLSYTWYVQGGESIGALDAHCVRIRWTSTGAWTLRITVNDGVCVWEDTLVVTVGDSLQPLITASGPSPLCEGDTLHLDAGAGYDHYLWSTPDSSIKARSIPVTRSGRYSVRVWDAQGCEGSSDPYTVMVFPAPIPRILGPHAFCPGDSIVLLPDRDYMRYKWSDGSTTHGITVRQPGSYHVEVVDSNGCVGVSRIHEVSHHPTPEKPVITQSADTLFATEAVSHQWFLDGATIEGATSASHRSRVPGSYTVRVLNEFGCAAESDPFVIEDLHALATVMLPELTVAPGDVIRLPLTLVHETLLDAVGAGAFSAIIRFDGNVLQPLATGSIVSRTDGRDLLISVSGAYRPGLTQLATLELIATLGDASMTPLIIHAFDWHDAEVSTRLVDGAVHLQICDEGGQRLYSSRDTVRLRQNRPNPFNAQTVIEYATIEKGHVALYVLDALGRRVSTLENTEKDPGEYLAVFDASDFPSGTYLCILSTPTIMKFIRMLVVK